MLNKTEARWKRQDSLQSLKLVTSKEIFIKTASIPPVYKVISLTYHNTPVYSDDFSINKSNHLHLMIQIFV